MGCGNFLQVLVEALSEKKEAPAINYEENYFAPYIEPSLTFIHVLKRRNNALFFISCFNHTFPKLVFVRFKNTLPVLAARGCRHRQKFHPAKEGHFQLMWRPCRDFGVADQNTEFGNH